MNYQSKKNSKSLSIFDSLIKYKNLKQKRIVAKEKLSKIDKKLEELLNDYNFSVDEYYDLKQERQKIDTFLNNSNRLMSSLKSKFIKVASIALASTITLCGSISFAANIKESNLNENIEGAYSYISEYPEFDTNKEDLDIIKDNPTQITQLALNCLKAKIAEHLNISDPTTITILDNSTYMSSSEYNTLGNGYLNKLSIIVELEAGKPISIAEYNSFQSLESGNINIIDQTMSDAIANNITSISTAQRAIKNGKSNAKKLAHNALKSSNDLKPFDISLPDAAKSLNQNSQFLDDEGR